MHEYSSSIVLVHFVSLLHGHLFVRCPVDTSGWCTKNARRAEKRSERACKELVAGHNRLWFFQPFSKSYWTIRLAYMSLAESAQPRTCRANFKPLVGIKPLVRHKPFVLLKPLVKTDNAATLWLWPLENIVWRVAMVLKLRHRLCIVTGDAATR